MIVRCTGRGLASESAREEKNGLPKSVVGLFREDYAGGDGGGCHTIPHKRGHLAGVKGNVFFAVLIGGRPLE